MRGHLRKGRVEARQQAGMERGIEGVDCGWRHSALTGGRCGGGLPARREHLEVVLLVAARLPIVYYSLVVAELLDKVSTWTTVTGRSS